MNESITRAAGGVNGQVFDAAACPTSRAASAGRPGSARRSTGARSRSLNTTNPGKETVLRLGYKASAEQFGPREAARVLRPRRGAGLRLRFHQRPFPAVAAHRRARAVRVRLAGRARRAHLADRHGHERADADLPLSPLASWRRPSARSAAMFPGRMILGRRHGRVAQRSARHGHGVAGIEGALRAAARGRSS